MKRNNVYCLFIDDCCKNKNKKENCLNCSIFKNFFNFKVKKEKK